MANTTTAAATTTARLHHHHHQQQQLLIRSYQRDGYFSRNVVYGRSTTTKNRDALGANGVENRNLLFPLLPLPLLTMI
jgi:hypothetical protein